MLKIKVTINKHMIVCIITKLINYFKVEPNSFKLFKITPSNYLFSNVLTLSGTDDDIMEEALDRVIFQCVE